MPPEPWLVEKPTALLPRPALEERILNLLASQNMAVIATVDADGRSGFAPRQTWRSDDAAAARLDG